MQAIPGPDISLLQLPCCAHPSCNTPGAAHIASYLDAFTTNACNREQLPGAAHGCVSTMQRLPNATAVQHPSDSTTNASTRVYLPGAAHGCASTRQRLANAPWVQHPSVATTHAGTRVSHPGGAPGGVTLPSSRREHQGALGVTAKCGHQVVQHTLSRVWAKVSDVRRTSSRLLCPGWAGRMRHRDFTSPFSRHWLTRRCLGLSH